MHAGRKHSAGNRVDTAHAWCRPTPTSVVEIVEIVGDVHAGIHDTDRPCDEIEEFRDIDRGMARGVDDVAILDREV